MHVLRLIRPTLRRAALVSIVLQATSCATTSDLGSRVDGGGGDGDVADMADSSTSVCGVCESWQACDTGGMVCIDCNSIAGGCADHRSRIATSRFHACAIRGDGDLYCWGNNGSGECGQAVLETINIPERVATLDHVVDVAAVSSRTCVRTERDGSTQALCFGLGLHGELVNGSFPSLEPQPMPVRSETGPLESANELALGGYHTCVRRRDATVLCGGDNRDGQSGGSALLSNVLQPTPIRNALSVAAGDSHTCVVIPDGPVLCWGSNADNRLGSEDAFSPAMVPGIARAVQVAAGYSHTCALDDNGVVTCWGVNDFAQLSGDAATTTPRQVAGLSAVQSISAGGAHSCALTMDRRLVCWGSNVDGELGQPLSLPSSDAPVEPMNLPIQGHIAEISAGASRTCVLGEATVGDGDVYCFGEGLGSRPVLIPFPLP